MIYKVVIPRRTQKSLTKLQPTDRERIRDAIFALAEDPRPRGARMLEGKTGGYLRIRVGNYRVIYRIEEEALTVVVVKVAHRREAYRNL